MAHVWKERGGHIALALALQQLADMKKQITSPLFIVAGAATVGILGYAAWKFWSSFNTPDAFSIKASPDHTNADHPMMQSGRDMVDEASWESFPASDAPARY